MTETAFSAIPMTKNVYWVGAVDWHIRDFHGYATSRGTTYNAYLILGKEPILIDTVKAPFYEEMMARIRSVIDPKKIRYIISNHAEMDHSGALAKTIAEVKPGRIFASRLGIQALREHFHWDETIEPIPTDRPLVLGDAEFHFLETRMLHWPDSMFTFYKNDGVLFSQDAFGMHLATYDLFADQHDKAILQYESAKYYANILLPYSSFVSKLLASIPSLKWDIHYLAPDHGPIWRRPEDIQSIMDAWSVWAQQKVYKKAIIVYATMWESTQKMADAVADGLREANIETKVLPMSGAHRSDVSTELLTAGALLIGSPTLNQQPFPTLCDVLCYLKGLKRKNLIGQVFGSYGWAPEGLSVLQKAFEEMEIELVGEMVKSKYVPTEEVLKKCHALGLMIGEKLNERTD